jgi:Ca2+-transporting ATPase
VSACCRVSPQHKTKIVDAFKAKDHVVAMTGDGVNDAPALKRANIGVAMGITGTDVSKETADMVLTDDNYASIVSAIEEGRIIYSNIRKFVFFLVACNIGEILIIFLSMLAGMPIPMRPIQLLMLNLVTDGAPALALGLEKGEPDIMRRPPRPTKEPVINKDMLLSIAVIAIADTFAVLTVFYLALQRFPGNVMAAQTVAFSTLVCSELLRAFTSRSETYSIFSIGVFSNKWMVLATGASSGIAGGRLPAFPAALDTVSLSERLADDAAFMLSPDGGGDREGVPAEEGRPAGRGSRSRIEKKRNRGTGALPEELGTPLFFLHQKAPIQNHFRESRSIPPEGQEGKSFCSPPE